MKTELIYLKDSYKKELEADILEVEVISPKLAKLILDQTIFFAEGGGQPSDQGKIVIGEKTYKVTQVRLEAGEVKHYIEVKEEMPEKGKCFIEIDWVRRYKNMQMHTAGHIIDWAISELKLHNDKIMPSKANHGKNPFIVYVGKSDEIEVNDIQKRVNKILENNLAIKVHFVNFDELKEKALYTFPNLPKDKPLRIVELNGYKAVPDGGTLLKKAGEIKAITIESIENEGETTVVKYNVEEGEKQKKHTLSSDQDIEKIRKTLKTIENESDEAIKDASTIQMLEKLEIKYLGRKSEFISILRNLKNLAYDSRAEIGSEANKLKENITKKITTKKSKLNETKLIEVISKEKIDVTQDGILPEVGHVHPTTNMMWKAVGIFESMGFQVVESVEVDTDFNHFTALNIPEGHPARDMWDTFFTEDNQVVVAHTSTMQNRILSKLKPPIRAIVPGRCFRNEATDASHEHTFYQIEGVYLDKNINIYHLISTMKTFLENFMEREVKIKIQPSYFPFVEPGLEILMEWDRGNGNKRWLEVMPAGMIHPNVLKHAGIDPDEYSGFAWGFGLDRLIMVKYGIDDIRYFHSGDLRFLKQF